MNEEQIERYSRHLLLKEIGGQGQQKLLSARVLVVGAGGLGAPILQYLAAAGVGTLGIIDNDVVSLSNLQRQIIYQTSDIGGSKTQLAARFVARLNPDVKLVTFEQKLDGLNGKEIIGQFDWVVEGVDNFATRFLLNRLCIDAKVPLVSAAVGRFDGQLSTFRPFDDFGSLPCYRCFVPQEPPRDQQVNCAEGGVLGALTGVVGTMAAMEVIKNILELGDTLVGRIAIYDALGGKLRQLRLRADPACLDCGGH